MSKKEYRMSAKTVSTAATGMMPGQVRAVYMTLLLFMALSGFGQMPIFKRYYIADFPGLGWLAQFYVTHYIHYVGAAALLAIGAYYLARYLVAERSRRASAPMARFKGSSCSPSLLRGSCASSKITRGIIFHPGSLFFWISSICRP
jgi:hypothetical protein